MTDNVLSAIDAVESASARIGFVSDAIVSLSGDYSEYDWSGAAICLADARRDLASAVEALSSR